MNLGGKTRKEVAAAKMLVAGFVLGVYAGGLDSSLHRGRAQILTVPGQLAVIIQEFPRNR